MKNDTTILTNFLKEYHRKYPTIDYLQLPIRECTKREFLESLVLSEYREELKKEIENRRRVIR